MKIIKERKEFHISIKELVLASSEYKFKNAEVPYRIRALKGMELHKSFQKSRKNSEKAFQGEKSVMIKIFAQGWNFIIRGRVDIVYEKEDRLIIEEIKSVSRINNFDIKSKLGCAYKSQLLLYAHHFYQIGYKIQCNLVLIDIFTGKTKVITIPFNDQSKYIDSQCKLILNNWEMEQKAKVKKRKRAKTIIFPFEKYRPNQEAIIQKTFQSLQNRERLMLSAPSGIGKTVGTLYPALKYTLKKNLRLFVVTSKTTQQHIYRDTLRLFSKKKANFNSILLTAKEKMCLNDKFLCDKSTCPYLENYEKIPLDPILKELKANQVLDARYIRKIAKKHKLCAFELSLDSSLFCDVIVGDFNYVFHPYIKLKRYFNSKYSDIIVIVDEAHNLPSRAMEYYSPEISTQSIRDVINQIQNMKISRSLKEKGISITKDLIEYISNLKPLNNKLRKKTFLVKFDKTLFREVVEGFDQFIIRYIFESMKKQGYQPSRKDIVIQFAQNLNYFNSLLKECDAAEYSELYYRNKGMIKILCKSAAPKLKKQFSGFHSVILQSATLIPMEYFRKMMGYPKSAKKLDYSCPHLKKNRLYLIDSQVSTKFEQREHFHSQIASKISSIVNIKRGNYLAFFPSFAYLKAVQKRIDPNNLRVELLVQEPKMSEAKRNIYLKKLRSNKKFLLLAVHGGIFSEGVDFYGDMAIGTFIIGPGLPAFSLEQEFLKDYYQTKWNKGFEYAYRNPGMIKVIQAAGRIFRTTKDKGFVMFFGYRFSKPYYYNVFPLNWNIRQPQNPIKCIREFWRILSSNEKNYTLNIQKKKNLFDYVG